MTLALIAFLAALLLAAPLHAAGVRVIDGDTIEIGSKTFRLHGKIISFICGYAETVGP